MSRTLGCTLIRSGWSCGDRKWLLGERPTCVADFTLYYFLLQFLILCLTNHTTLTGVLHKMLIFTELINTAHRSVVYCCGHCTNINTVHPSYFRKVRLNTILRAHPVHLWGYQVPPFLRVFCTTLGTRYPSVPRMLHAQPSPCYALSDDPVAV
jgi:hypothetical protein